MEGTKIEEQNIEILSKTLENDRLTKRFILNAFIEMLNIVTELKKDIIRLNDTINIVGMDKLSSYFKELDANIQKEEVKANVKEKIKKSHMSAKKK